MQVLRSVNETRRAVAQARAAGRTIGLVPTMGALHDGHRSLMRAALIDGHWLVVSIFVNPTQFGPSEDLAKYPRDEAGDLETCRRAGVSAVFAPSVDEMYDPQAATRVRVERLTDHLCGPRRPGHFEGVATIVAKLLNIVTPDAAYFGQKDAQQLAVIRRMVADLQMSVRVVGCPTVREPDGLALSSRNAYLSPDERRRAARLSQALTQAKNWVAGGMTDAAQIRAAMLALLDEAAPTRIDYVELVDAGALQPVTRVSGPTLIALAVWFGATRLIDNITVDPGEIPG